MRAESYFPISKDGRRPLAVILGTNEIASAIALRLHRDGFAAALSRDPLTPVIRRSMSFHDCLFGDLVTLDSVEAERAENALELVTVLDHSRRIAVTPMQFHDLVALRAPDALIDARMRNAGATPDLRHLARLAVGLGPNYAENRNCDVAVDVEDPAVASIERKGADPRVEPVVLHARRQGLWHTAIDIGVRVFKNFVVGHLDGEAVEAPLDGVLSGVARDGSHIPAGAELLEIDPHGRGAHWRGVDERFEAIARAVARAVRVELACREASRAPGSLVAH